MSTSPSYHPPQPVQHSDHPDHLEHSDPTGLNQLDDKTIKCIRCGFCLDACPTFRLSGQETRSPRGRIYLVRSWREHKIPFNDDLVAALDSCLGCRACETACPSGVEYGSILEMARSYIEEAGLRPASHSFARAQFLGTLTSPSKLNASLKAAGIVGKLTGGKMPAFAAKLLSGSAHNRSDEVSSISLPQGEARIQNMPTLSRAHGARRYTVGVVAGCVMRVMFGDVNAATVRVLQANGCDVICPSTSGCCGALHLHTGFHADGLTRARSLIESFEGCIDDLDAIVINSAGCGSTLKEYDTLLASDASYADRAKRFAGKVKDVSEWLIEIGVRPPKLAQRDELIVTYHEACHLAHGQRVRLQPRQILQAIPGVRVIEMDESDTCCGSAGIYNITEPMTARQLLNRKIENIRHTGASVVATANPGCLAWIRQGASEMGMSLRICHPVELLDEAYRQE